MNKSTIITKLFGVTLFLSLLLLNVGSLRGESRPKDPSNLQKQAKRGSPELRKTQEEKWLDDSEGNNEKFKELEWLIKQRLLKQYEKMEAGEDLEDNHD